MLFKSRPAVPSLAAYLDTWRRNIDSHLERVAAEASMPPVLRPVVETAMRSPGKRVRGILTIAAGEAFGARGARLLDAAAAVEMIHTSSLILDDLPSMDDAELRRGAPALHRAFGEDLAVLAAVALLNHAYGRISANHASLLPRRWRPDEVLQRVVSAVGWDGSVGGEAVDLHSEAARLDFQTLEYIHSRKTGALFVACGAVGAMLANAPAAGLGAIEAYAKNLGLAFQITDDILDVTASQEQLGKDVGKDEGKLTFVRLAGVEGARKLNEELIETSVAAIAALGSSGKTLRELALFVRDRAR